MKVSFTPTTGDLVRIGYVGMRTRSFVFWFSIVFFVVLPWLLAGIGIAMQGTANPMSWASIVMLAVMPPIMVALFAFIPVLVTRGAKTLNGVHTYEFSSDGIRMSGPGFQNRMEWSALNTCVSSPLGVIFMSAKVAFLSVPGRVLDQSSRSVLVSLAKDKGLLVRPLR